MGEFIDSGEKSGHIEASATATLRIEATLAGKDHGGAKREASGEQFTPWVRGACLLSFRLSLTHTLSCIRLNTLFILSFCFQPSTTVYSDTHNVPPPTYSDGDTQEPRGEGFLGVADVLPSARRTRKATSLTTPPANPNLPPAGI